MKFTRCPICKCKEVAYMEYSRGMFGEPVESVVKACSKDASHNYKLKNKLVRT